MQSYAEVRLAIYKIGPLKLRTSSIVAADWPLYQHQGWHILAIDPEDDLAYVYWREQGWPPLSNVG